VRARARLRRIEPCPSTRNSPTSSDRSPP
jgi:hypothetical protein